MTHLCTWAVEEAKFSGKDTDPKDLDRLVSRHVIPTPGTRDRDIGNVKPPTKCYPSVTRAAASMAPTARSALAVLKY